MNTPTPRTEAATYPADCLGKTLVTNRDCSRELERELTALTAERDQLRFDAASERLHGGVIFQLTAERDQLRAALALGQINCDNAYGDLRSERDELRAELAKERARVRVLREASKKCRQTVILGGSNPARDALAGLRKDAEELREDAIARAEKAEAQLHALRLVCGTTDANKFETWTDRANARAEKAEGQLKELVAYASALEDQLDSVGVQIARTAMKEDAK